MGFIYTILDGRGRAVLYNGEEKNKKQKSIIFSVRNKCIKRIEDLRRNSEQFLYQRNSLAIKIVRPRLREPLKKGLEEGESPSIQSICRELFELLAIMLYTVARSLGLLSSFLLFGHFSRKRKILCSILDCAVYCTVKLEK